MLIVKYPVHNLSSYNFLKVGPKSNGANGRVLGLNPNPVHGDQIQRKPKSESTQNCTNSVNMENRSKEVSKREKKESSI